MKRDNKREPDIQDEIKMKLNDILKSNYEVFFRNHNVAIVKKDIIKLQSIKKESVDLLVTSPPYSVDIKYNSYDDNIPYDKYLEFTRQWLQKCYELAKPDGRFCLNIPLDKNKGGQQSVYADIAQIAKEVGWKYHSTIIWNEGTISRRTAWGSWKSASAPYVIAPVEVIVILYKEVWKKRCRGENDITTEEFKDWTNGLWEFSGAKKSKIGHPTPFPIELPKRCIKLFSYVGDVVLDPFMGSGATLIACMQNKRIGIGVDIDEKYCRLAIRRLKEYGLGQQKLTEHPQSTHGSSP